MDVVVYALLKGQLDNKANLVDGKIPADELPSYVDDVLEFATRDNFPTTGEESKIYVALDTNYTYRWSGSTYVQIGAGCTYQAFPSAWPTTNTTTTKQFCDAVNNYGEAVIGMAYLGGASFSDLPFVGNGDIVVEILHGPSSTKSIHLILTSGDIAPYRWEYTYWNNGSNVSGWIGFQPEITTSNKLPASKVSGLATVATTGTYNDLSGKPTIPTVEANPAGTASFELTTINIDGVVYEIKSGSNGIEEITYSNLVSKKANSELVSGQYYRITDYVTKINGVWDLQPILGTTAYLPYAESVEHPFDVIVLAIDTNKLSEDALAVIHSGDTYFSNCKLNAWKLKYSLENDASRYSWANTTNGKGVIYYMKDEYNNECWYDFKSIKFVAYALKASLIGGQSSYVDTSLAYNTYTPRRFGNLHRIYSALQNYMTTGSYVSPYARDYDFDVGANILGVIQFTEINSTFKSAFNAETYYTFDYYDSSNDTHVDMSLSGRAHDNSISNSPDAISSIVSSAPFIEHGLPFNIFQFGSYDNDVASFPCRANKLGEKSYGNIFGTGSSDNTALVGLQFNSFGFLSNDNFINYYVTDNVCGFYFSHNVIENQCWNNQFGNDCQYNNVKFYVTNNQFCNSVHNTIIGNYFEYNIVNSGVLTNVILDSLIQHCTLIPTSSSYGTGINNVHIHGNISNVTLNDLPAYMGTDEMGTHEYWYGGTPYASTQDVEDAADQAVEDANDYTDYAIENAITGAINDLY